MNAGLIGFADLNPGLPIPNPLMRVKKSCLAFAHALPSHREAFRKPSPCGSTKRKYLPAKPGDIYAPSGLVYSWGNA